MLTWILVAAAIALAAAIMLRTRSFRRTQRRRLRRSRRKMYQRLWDQVMVRPRMKRLASSSPPEAIEADPEPRLL